MIIGKHDQEKKEYMYLIFVRCDIKEVLISMKSSQNIAILTNYY